MVNAKHIVTSDPDENILMDFRRIWFLDCGLGTERHFSPVTPGLKLPAFWRYQHGFTESWLLGNIPNVEDLHLSLFFYSWKIARV